MLMNEAVYRFAIRGKRAQRRPFVLPREAAVAVNIGAEYGSELTLQTLTSRKVRLDLSGDFVKA